MRLFTGTSLFIQVFGKVFFQDFKLSPKYGFAPMGSFVVLALTSMRLIPANQKTAVHPAGLGKSSSGDPWPVS
jgi:hypothetical protein